MSEIKSIDKANLELALSENNNKLKDYILDKTNRIDIAQKTVNTELDYFSAYTNPSNSYNEIQEIIPLENVSSNMNYSYENRTITLKKGKRYFINADIRTSKTENNAPYGRLDFYIRDMTNNKILGNLRGNTYSPTATFTEWSDHELSGIFTPTEDIDIALQVYLNQYVTSYAWMNINIFEISKQVAVDPVNYINDSQGLEDTPVGHIIAHMGIEAPKHYLICDGTEYQINDYPYLAQHIKDSFGRINYFGGNGTETFAVPDLRGEFLRGSGENGHENQGSGADVGQHQDATGSLNISVGTQAELWADIRKNAYTQNFDSYYDFDTTDKSRYKWNTGGTWDSSPELGSYYTSRPTNTSVLYCIKYEPTYFMNVSNTNYMQPTLYSEQEKVVGCWIDGKPLYQRTIEVTSPSSTSAVKITESFGDIKIINIDAVLISSNNEFIPINYYGSAGDAFSLVYSNGFTVIVRHTVYLNRPILITFRYTKDTDAENSFTESMLRDSYVKLEATCTEEEIQQAILEATAEINAEEPVEEVIEEPTETIVEGGEE